MTWSDLGSDFFFFNLFGLRLVLVAAHGISSRGMLTLSCGICA